MIVFFAAIVMLFRIEVSNLVRRKVITTAKLLEVRATFLILAGPIGKLYRCIT